MKTYVQERDEFIADTYTDIQTGPVYCKILVDFGKSYSDKWYEASRNSDYLEIQRIKKEVAEAQELHLRVRSLAEEQYRKDADKISAQIEIIAKMEDALIWYAVYADEIVLDHHGGKERSKKKEAKEALTALKDFREKLSESKNTLPQKLT